MLDSGLCKICSVEWDDTKIPKTRILVTKVETCFEERTVGINRNYEAARNGQHADRLIRIWRTPEKICFCAVLHPVRKKILRFLEEISANLAIFHR